MSHLGRSAISKLRHDFDLTSWRLVTSPVLERQPQDEDVLPHRYGTIRHRLTTSVDHRRSESVLQRRNCPVKA